MFLVLLCLAGLVRSQFCYNATEEPVKECLLQTDLLKLSFCDHYEPVDHCCTSEEDRAIGDLYARLKDKNADNAYYDSPEDGFPELKRERCLYRLGLFRMVLMISVDFLVCQPCSSEAYYSLPVCGRFCQSIAEQCAEFFYIDSINDVKAGFPALNNITYINPMNESDCAAPLPWYQPSSEDPCFNSGSRFEFLIAGTLTLGFVYLIFLSL